MSSLTNTDANITYKDLLQMGNAGGGVTGSVLTVQDGNGNNTALGLSTTTVSAAALTINGKAVTLAGALTTSGAFGLTFTLTGTTNITLPTSGTVLTSGSFAAGIQTWLSTPSSANLLAAMTTSTGTGNLVFATSPTLVTPVLGTVASGNISACTSTSMVMVSPVLGTPTSGVLTNCTGTASGLTAGNVTTNANLTGDVTSSGNATTLASGVVAASNIKAASGAGIPVQIVFGSLTSTTSIASSTPVTSGVTASITPTLSTSQILVRAVINFGINSSDVGFVQLQRGVTAIGVGAGAGSRTTCGSGGLTTGSASSSYLTSVTLEWLDNPATTSSTTYTVYAWTSGGSQSYINRTVTDTNSATFPRAASTITLTEIK